MIKPQLVLDIAGVIVTNLSPSYWEEIARSAEISYNTVKELFNQEARDALWTGRMSEQQFWEWLTLHCPTIETQYARQVVNKHLKVLPAIKHLEHWSQIADIHLLSNHRHEWLVDLLRPVEQYIQTTTISSEVGFCKPDISIYNLVNSRIKSGPVIYVDDQEKNLNTAQHLGWITVIADQEGKWTDGITNILEKLINT